ncbi:CocE/NonD family hydrolase [Sediminibacterium sp. KACHI17]|uniref:CocE/NonD family hydrolase n=1 Tax=Sediminibacterium sp. KACHI17 TaxID=1751071 RepID=A0AAT9GGG0_9BACT
MKKIVILLLLTLPFVGLTQGTDSAWIVNNYTKKEVYIPMRDGVKLFTSIYLPKNVSEKHPILLTRTPYSCAPYGEDKFAAFWSSPRSYFMKEHYIYVQQDVRGRWMSEGVFEDVRPYNPNKKGTETDEASDTYDTIDWLVKNLTNNNGNVGVFGISYPGFYSTMAALSNHPALKAVSPQAPVTEWFLGDDFHHNGAFMLMDGFAFYSGFGKPRPKPTTIGPKGFDFPTKDNYEFYLRTGALTNFTKLMGDSIKFWKDLMSHPNYDAWWKARDARANVQFISQDIPTLVVGGLYDAEDCYGAWNLYKAIEKKTKNNNKIVMGPWYHGQWARTDGSFLGNVQWGSNTSEWYGKNVELPFFNYYLKQKGNIDQLQEATIFFSGSNEWKQLPKWPLDQVSYESYALRKGGYLSKAVPLIAPLSSWQEYTSDPAKPVPYTEDVHFGRTREYMTDDQRFAARRPDVLVFQTEPLENDLTLAGPITADLMVAISGTDADFVVKLIDVFPDDFKYEKENGYVMNGYQMLVRGEVMRGKFRNSFEKPEPFVPNKPTRVKYELPDVAHTFKKGHRLMIQVQSSWFPLVDRNPQQFMDIYQAKDSDFKKATIRIYHNDSKIVLPVLK